MYVRSKRNNRKQDFERRKKMRTLTLSDSVFRAQLQHSCPKFQKSINSHPSLLSLIPLSQKQKFNHFTRNLISSRFSRKLSQNSTLDDTWLDQNRRSSSDTHSIIQHGFDAMDKANVDISSRSGNCSSTVFELDDSTVSDTSFHSLLKFSVLFGLLTLQGTQQALAGSEFATGLQLLPYLGDLGDISTGFASAFLLIFFSELGDKTFFIAALLAARNSGAIVFLGTFGALALMTIISVVLGRTFHYVDDILPFRFGETDLPIDDIAAVGLLVYFGVSTLIEAASSDGLKTEGEQKEAELAVSEFSGDGAGILAAANTVISTFALVFVAEWGDKSFFSTIALSAASSPLGVIGGALAGHAAATLLAVLGGSLLGTFLSEKVIAYVGGTLFLVFAAVTVIEIVS